MTTTYTTNFRFPKPDFRASGWHQDWYGAVDRIDAIIYSALVNSEVTTWANATAYTIGQTRIDTVTGKLYVCNVAHTSAVAPTTFSADRVANPTYWTPVALTIQTTGEWDNSTAYYYNDVAYDLTLGIYAICRIEHTSNAGGDITDDAANWDFIVDFDASSVTAEAVSFDGTLSGLAATDVQAAIEEVVSDFATALALKSPLASPTFTGTVTIPTVAGSADNSTKAASTAFVQAVKAAIIDSAPAGLDTLNELAAAIGDDAAFSTTITNALALKAALASPAFTGNPTAPTQTAGNNSTRLATTAYADTSSSDAAAAAVAALTFDIVKLTTLTASASAELTDTTHLTSVYKNFLVVFRNIKPATNDAGFRMEVSVDGGATWKTTGYEGSTDPIAAGSVVSPTTYVPLSGQPANDGVYSTGQGLSGELKLLDPTGAAADKIFMGKVQHKRGVDGGWTGQHIFHWYTGVSNPINALRFYMSTGNIASGTIEIYGLK